MKWVEVTYAENQDKDSNQYNNQNTSKKYNFFLDITQSFIKGIDISTHTTREWI